MLEKENDEVRECTFKPRINKSKGRRTNDEFIKDQIAYLMRKEKKISQAKDREQERLSMKLSKKPRIGTKSRKLATN